MIAEASFVLSGARHLLPERTAVPGSRWKTCTMVKKRGSVSAQQAAEICGCSVDEVEEYRRNVLPRPKGAVPDPKRFSASEVVAIAAGAWMRSWRSRTGLPFVARLAL